ncbi:MAG: hypothetical protein ACOX6H_01950 [Christensenellales bacterium]|jgi:hypothetical protein
MTFEYRGVLYSNGYRCNKDGFEICMKNGYSKEDELASMLAYEHAVLQTNLLAQIEAENFNKKLQQNIEKMKKYTKKIKLPQEEISLYDEDGNMLNDAGAAITLENGYTDEDILYTQKNRSFER